jgi:hypothetical protein
MAAGRGGLSPGNCGQPSTQVVLQWEYEDMAERERMWAEWNDLPTTPPFLQKCSERVEPGITTEIWSVQTG